MNIGFALERKIDCIDVTKNRQNSIFITNWGQLSKRKYETVSLESAILFLG